MVGHELGPNLGSFNRWMLRPADLQASSPHSACGAVVMAVASRWQAVGFGSLLSIKTQTLRTGTVTAYLPAFRVVEKGSMYGAYASPMESLGNGPSGLTPGFPHPSEAHRLV